MSNNMEKFWEISSKKLLEFVNKPEKFLSAQPSISEKVRGLTKELYDLTKTNEEKKESGEALPELIIDHFDDEQVWQQLELQNSDSYDALMSKVSRLMAKKKAAKALKLAQALSNSNLDLDDEEDAEDEISNKVIRKTKRKKNIKAAKAHMKSSVVDDKFFKLQQMEEFLLKEEAEEKVGSDEESVDLFADDAESDEDEGGEQYKDFFDPPEGEEIPYKEVDAGEEESDEGEENLEDEEGDDISNGDEEGNDGELDENEDDDVEEESLKPQADKKTALLSDGESDAEDEAEDMPKSNFELRQERLKKKIEHIHDEALGEKPWQLLGEITSTTRPQNSLLEEVLQFDRTQRPAPVITEQTTVKLEDIIKQRVKDKAWDNVERKVKPVEEITEYKKRLTLDQSKSKLSLAEIYEQDYLKQKEKVNPTNEDEEEEDKETPEQIEIKKMMKSLFLKLDAISNYHYTPRITAPDVKVITNLPAITVEEVAPVASSDAALLAPEEVKGKQRGNAIGKEERTSTDKKRERRNKKAKQRVKRKAREAKEIVGAGTKAAVKRAIKEGRVKELEVSDRNAVKSSSAFFNRLQEEVSSSLSQKKQEMKRKKSQENRLPAKMLKL